MMCGYDPAQGTCWYDDGDPLYDKTKNLLVGVYSGYDYCGAKPSVFSRISSEWKWIRNTICNNHSNPKPDLCKIGIPPTGKPSRRPVNNPTRKPTKNLSRKPTKKPISSPTKKPTRKPTMKPSRKPTKQPSKKPTRFV